MLRDLLTLCVVMAIAFIFCDAAWSQPVFTDTTESAGLTYLQQAYRSPPNCIFDDNFCELERMTGGAATGDIDGDGYLDLYVTRLDAPGILFRNRGDGTFEDVTTATGLATLNLHSNGAVFVDVDNDGDLDLYITVIGVAGDLANNHNYLFLNDGNGKFTQSLHAGDALLADGGVHRSFSVAVGDYDRDGWLDLHTTEWFPFFAGSAQHSRLLHNRGRAEPGVFDDLTAAAGVTLEDSAAFASAFTDLDGDRWPDLVVAADYGTSRLYWNNADGTFRDGTAAAGVGTEQFGMGSTVGDFDGDGDLDWFVTAIFDTEFPSLYSGNRLYRNTGHRSFSDATDWAGVRDGSWGWGAVLFDYDNDGDLDLVMTNGMHVPESVTEAFLSDPVRLWENNGAGQMTEVSAARGLTDTGSGKGLLVFDYDNDGDLDLFIVNNAGTPRLYRNDGGNANGWLRVRTKGTSSNREGIGARVTVQQVLGGAIQVREIGTASHFLGQSEAIAHFGLGPGSASVAQVRVSWPSGLTQTFTDVPRNTTLVAEEPLSTSEGTPTSVPTSFSTPTPTLPATSSLTATATRSATPGQSEAPSATTTQALPSVTASPAKTATRPPITPTSISSLAIHSATPRRCAGDCNGDGRVRIDELVRGVDIILGNIPTSACLAFDLNFDGFVTVDELVTAVGAVLNACGQSESG